MKVHCNKCNNATNHIIILDKTEREIVKIEEYPLIDFWQDHLIYVLRCGSCGDLVLRTATVWCDDAPDFPEKNEVFYPKRGSHSIPLAESLQNIPEKIASVYKETTEAFIQDLPRLCAGGLRAIIEAVCKEKQIKGGNTSKGYETTLAGKICGLSDQGLITKNHADILHQHRFLGNEALHELEEPSLEELGLAIEVLAHTLNTVYGLHFKGQELKNKRNARI